MPGRLTLPGRAVQRTGPAGDPASRSL